MQSASSRTNTPNNRLIILATSVQKEVIAHLSRQADDAYTLRQLDRVDAIGRQLEETHAPIASYYRGLAAQRHGSGNLSKAQRLLEDAASFAPRRFQARALFILGSIAEYRRDYRAELDYYRHALELNHNDAFTAIEARRAVAISESREGNHARAIEILESLLPLAAHRPHLQLQVLNSLAVEFHRAGRLKDALRLAQIVCASPLATVYHEWRETREEVNRSIAEQESRAIIVAAPNIKANLPEGKREGKPRQAPKRILWRGRTWVARSGLAFGKFASTAPLIQSRVYASAPIHAPPFRAGK
jgi:tetratricopeptide (TPR) repeat protein